MARVPSTDCCQEVRNMVASGIGGYAKGKCFASVGKGDDKRQCARDAHKELFTIPWCAIHAAKVVKLEDARPLAGAPAPPDPDPVEAAPQPKKRKAPAKKKVQKPEAPLPDPPDKSGPYQKRVDLAVARVTKELEGKVAIRKASDRTYVYSLRRPSGILSLDIGWGGGLPAGSLNQIYGKESTGKNYLMNCLIRECQRNYGSDAAVAYVTFEYGYDKAFAWLCGVSCALSDVELKELKSSGKTVSDETMRQATEQIGSFHIVDVTDDGRAIPAEAKFEAALGLLEEGVFQLILIDGLGAFLGMGQRFAKKKGKTQRRTLMDERKVGEEPRLLTSFMSESFTRLGLPAYDGGSNETTIVVNNQVRANIGVQGRGPTTRQGGGYALGHGKALDTHLKTIGQLTRGAEKRKVGKKTAWVMGKGKLGTHDGKAGEYDYFYDGGVDLIGDMITVARAMKVIQSRGSKIYVPGRTAGMSKEEVETKFYYGDDEAAEIRRGTLRDAVLEAAGLTHVRVT
jgi:RecA/RadA recombinase